MLIKVLIVDCGQHIQPKLLISILDLTKVESFDFIRSYVYTHIPHYFAFNFLHISNLIFKSSVINNLDCIFFSIYIISRLYLTKIKCVSNCIS